MIFKKTKLNIADTSGYLLGRVFHVYSKKKYLNYNGFVYLSIRDTYVKLQHHIGKKKRMFIVNSKKNKRNIDCTLVDYTVNGAVPVKKRISIIGNYTKGPVKYNTKRKKLLTSFSSVILC